MISFPRCFSALIKTWGLFILVLGVLASFFNVFRLIDYNALVMGLCFLTIIFVVFLVVKVKSVVVSRRVIIIILLLGCILVALWGLIFNSGQVSDFGVYYRCGISVGFDIAIGWLSVNQHIWKIIVLIGCDHIFILL